MLRLASTVSQGKREIVVCRDLAELSRRAAEMFVEAAENSIADHGRFAVALSGGTTPKATYGLLASEFRDRIRWTHVDCFWSDERCVPPDHPESNFRMANEALLSHVDIPAANVHRMKGEDPDPAHAAEEYDRQLRSFFRTEIDPPEFDLLMLGMGADGHTASLFPGTAALQERRAFAAANYVEKFRGYRLTLTLPVLNAAKKVIFLVAGADKSSALAKVLSDRTLPASLVQPPQGTTLWLLDTAAAALLKK
jgi:6-phosphogluconolactonase